ncbi:hypothetical protein [Streptomyces sp. CB00072]|uniref:hypothetical protein n=1 Tax=Streptomyces sp. CB00072 TaxID=1703928 RepID=UPI000AA19AEE|nr:hypothetical protein [Streptomyces sp. CB00072]
MLKPRVASTLRLDGDPAAHSWDVTDPLADLMAERIREEVRRDRDGGGGLVR